MQKKDPYIINLAPLADKSRLDLPFAASPLKAGFPSPAEDYLEPSVDLNKELITHPASTFFGRVSGDSMIDAGIHDGDVLIIDKSLEPYNGAVAVCFIDGEFTLKFIKIAEKCLWLIPANPAYTPIKVTSGRNFLIWGILTYVIKKASRLDLQANIKCSDF